MPVPYLTLPGFTAPHGFTTRAGGVSEGPYASLNLGLSSGDDRSKVEANRALLLETLGVSREQVCGYHQVHGARVMVETPGWFEEEADASVSADPRHLLVVSAADCYPVLFHDPVTGAAGAAHCGWRGTLQRLPGQVVEAMVREYGTDPRHLRVAVGQGVGGRCYQVDMAVGERFLAAGFPVDVLFDGPPPPDLADLARQDGGVLLDVHAAVLHSLAEAGVPRANVVSLGRCTHCEPASFFSHRRDRGLTGRMWGFVRPTAPPR
jgi:YfiH family protein